MKVESPQPEGTERSERSLINTPPQRGVAHDQLGVNRFNGFLHGGKPLKRFAFTPTSPHPTECNVAHISVDLFSS
jgi:hypothetical protein